MTQYKVRMAKTKYVDLFVEAKNKKEASQKAEEGLYSDVIEDEFLLPSTDYEVIKVEKVINNV